MVEDVGIEQQRTRDWAVTRLFVRRPGKGLRRRGETLTVEWRDAGGLQIEESGQGAANLLATFEQLNAADLAGVLHGLSSKRRVEVAAALDDEKLADVLEELPEEDQVEILGQLEQERAADVLEAMQPDDAADLLSELPQADAEKLLQLMEPDEAAPLRRLLAYSDDTAGGMMTTEPIILPPDATVADALARVRQPELSPALAAQVYVCRPPMETPTGRFIGIAHIQRLLREPPSALVSGVVDSSIEPLHPEAPLAAITHHLATYNMVAAPVVDENDHLLGAVTVDDVLDHLLPEDWRHDGRPAPGHRRGERGTRWRVSLAGRPGSTSPARYAGRWCRRRRYDPDAFGRFSERIARFIGTGRFLVYMTVFVVVWIAWNAVEWKLQYDDYPFILLTLMLSLQASYAAPLILLAQNRQADRDRVQYEQDRSRAERNIADTDYLTRELASLRMAVGDVATRDFLRSELRQLLDDLEERRALGTEPARDQG